MLLWSQSLSHILIFSWPSPTHHPLGRPPPPFGPVCALPPYASAPCYVYTSMRPLRVCDPSSFIAALAPPSLVVFISNIASRISTFSLLHYCMHALTPSICMPQEPSHPLPFMSFTFRTQGLCLITPSSSFSCPPSFLPPPLLPTSPLKASSTNAFSIFLWIIREHLEMTSKQCHFKIFPKALSHKNSLVYSRNFVLCLYKCSKTLIVSITPRKGDCLVCLKQDKVKFLTLQVGMDKE